MLLPSVCLHVLLLHSLLHPLLPHLALIPGSHRFIVPACKSITVTQHVTTCQAAWF
jgi:hypothetical protein